MGGFRFFRPESLGELLERKKKEGRKAHIHAIDKHRCARNVRDGNRNPCRTYRRLERESDLLDLATGDINAKGLILIPLLAKT